MVFQGQNPATGSSTQQSIAHPAAERKGGDIRESRAPAPSGGVDMDRKENKAEKWERNIHDRFNPIKALQKDVAAAHPGATNIPDPYYEKRVQPGHDEADRRAIGLIADEYSRFLKEYKNVVTHDDVDRYLKARDALYRNPDMKRRLGVDDGAGISDATAQAWLDGFQF